MKDVLIALADAVSQTVASFRGDAGAVKGMGADGTPTQEIDKVAEDAVLRYLDAHNIPLNVLSEEAGFVDRGGSPTLVLDPIDGTYNAVRGVPLYATSLAVGDDQLSTVTSGLVRDLPRGDTYYAERGQGASCNGIPIATRRYRRGDTLFSVYLGTMADPASYEVARTARRVRNLGAASLDLCGVAAGMFDVYYMKSRAEARLRVVDVAAGVLLVREAGGVVVTPEGEDLDMPIDLRSRTNLVAAGDRAALEALP